MRFLKHLYRIVILNPRKRRDDVFELGRIAFELRKFLTAILEHSTDDECNELFGEIHYVVELGIGNFRLNHPEFGEVSPRLGFFGAERRSEAIDLSERGCVCFVVKLAGLRKISLSVLE